jgi:hypothetical protein
MDANGYEYQSYTIIRHKMKDRGAFSVEVRPDHIAVARRRKFRLRKGLACVHAHPFALPAPAAEQDNFQTAR